MRVKLTITLLLLSFSILANPIAEEWEKLDDEYHFLVQSNDYKRALKVALKLNSIDPANSTALLYIVLASKKSGVELPKWVMSNPWPTATNKDLFNRKMAEETLKGS